MSYGDETGCGHHPGSLPVKHAGPYCVSINENSVVGSVNFGQEMGGRNEGRMHPGLNLAVDLPGDG